METSDVRHAIEQNRPVQGVEQGLLHGADLARAGSQTVQTQDERAAAAMREAAHWQGHHRASGDCRQCLVA